MRGTRHGPQTIAGQRDAFPDTRNIVYVIVIVIVGGTRKVIATISDQKDALLDTHPGIRLSHGLHVNKAMAKIIIINFPCAVSLNFFYVLVSVTQKQGITLF